LLLPALCSYFKEFKEEEDLQNTIFAWTLWSDDPKIFITAYPFTREEKCRHTTWSLFSWRVTKSHFFQKKVPNFSAFLPKTVPNHESMAEKMTDCGNLKRFVTSQ